MFGFISISDKYGSIPNGGSHIFEPDFVYVPIFDHEWCNPIDMHNRKYICLGNPSSPNSVAFSSSVKINMEIYVTDEEKKACYEIFRTKVEVDLSNIWSRNLGSKCSLVKAKGGDAYTQMYYTLIKDAVDVVVEIRPYYWALLFQSDAGIALGELGSRCGGLEHYARDYPNLKAPAFVPDDAGSIYDTDAELEVDEPSDELVYPDRGEALVIQRVLNMAVSKSVDDNSAQVDHGEDIDEEDIEMEENMVEEEEGFVGGDESDFQKDENEIPNPEQEMDKQNFHFQVNANLEQSRMEVDKIWKDFDADVIDLDHFIVVMSILHKPEKESRGKLDENMRGSQTLKKLIFL
nr:arginine--tRNA ligase, chloroplastic/mitochondrial [Tanacetum cinerariifolium]